MYLHAMFFFFFVEKVERIHYPHFVEGLKFKITRRDRFPTVVSEHFISFIIK